LAVLTVGCSEYAAGRRYDQAQRHIREGEFVEAVRLLDQVIARYPETEAAEHARNEVTLFRGLAGAVERYPLRRVRDQMIETARAVYKFRSRGGGWPSSLSRLTPKYLDGPLRDPWGRPLVYVVKPRGRGYVLACYGSDGQRGGAGEASDWFIENGSFVAKPSVSLP
jgi:hypothetical protein